MTTAGMEPRLESCRVEGCFSFGEFFILFSFTYSFYTGVEPSTSMLAYLASPPPLRHTLSPESACGLQAGTGTRTKEAGVLPLECQAQEGSWHRACQLSLGFAAWCWFLGAPPVFILEC